MNLDWLVWIVRLVEQKVFSKRFGIDSLFLRRTVFTLLWSVVWTISYSLLRAIGFAGHACLWITKYNWVQQHSGPEDQTQTSRAGQTSNVICPMFNGCPFQYLAYVICRFYWMGGEILQCIYPKNDVRKQVETPIFLYNSVERHSPKGSVEVLLCVSLIVIVCIFIASGEKGWDRQYPSRNKYISFFIKGVLINDLKKLHFQEL